MYKVSSYQELAEQIRERILGGALKPESLLGTEVGLSRDTGLSRSSVRLAISGLVDEGLVERQPGKGIYIRQLRSQRIIELVLPGLQGIWKDVAQGVQEVGAAAGCRVQIFNACSDFQSDMEMLCRLPSLNVDGAIIGSLHQREMTTEIVKLHLSGLPIVLLDQEIPDLGVPSVTFDNYQAGYVAGTELIKAGHQRIGFVGYDTLSERINGLRDAVNDGGVAFDRTNIVSVPVALITGGIKSHQETRKEELASCVQNLMEKENPPTAIVFYNTGMALYGVRCLQSLGYSVPEDISVVGIGEESEWEWIDSMLSTVVLPALQMGRIAAEKLIQRMEDPSATVGNTVLPVGWKSQKSVKEIKPNLTSK